MRIEHDHAIVLIIASIGKHDLVVTLTLMLGQCAIHHHDLKIVVDLLLCEGMIRRLLGVLVQILQFFHLEFLQFARNAFENVWIEVHENLVASGGARLVELPSFVVHTGKRRRRGSGFGFLITTLVVDGGIVRDGAKRCTSGRRCRGHGESIENKRMMKQAMRLEVWREVSSKPGMLKCISNIYIHECVSCDLFWARWEFGRRELLSIQRREYYEPPPRAVEQSQRVIYTLSFTVIMGIKGLAKLLSDEAPDVSVFGVALLCFHAWRHAKIHGRLLLPRRLSLYTLSFSFLHFHSFILIVGS